MSGQLWNKNVLCSLKLMLCCCFLLRLKSNIPSTIQIQYPKKNGVHQSFPGPTMNIWLVHTRTSPEVSRGHSCVLGSFLADTAVSECVAQSEVLSCLDQVFICSFQLAPFLWAVSPSQLRRNCRPHRHASLVMVLGRWKVKPGFLQTWCLDLIQTFHSLCNFSLHPADKYLN